MFDENQFVKIKWANKTRKYYESKGYAFTKYGDEFVVRAKDLPNGSKARVEICCDFCGDKYNTSLDNYNKRSNKTIDACHKCRVYKQWYKTKKDRAEDKFALLEKICDENEYKLITNESEYSGVFMDIEYICKKHGKQKQTLDNLLHGHKCISCSYEERRLLCMHDKKYVESVVNSVNGNILLNPGEYTGVFDRNLRIKCGECGNEYVTDFDSYVYKNQTRCKSCSRNESVGEFRIRKFLERHKIRFEQWKTFQDCKDKRCLPFDFYLPDYNLIIEFDGQHHFYEVGYGNHESTKAHDAIKNKYCQDNDVNILRIPYWEGNNIENIVANKLNL